MRYQRPAVARCINDEARASELTGQSNSDRLDPDLVRVKAFAGSC
jgi:hypothetical protein